MSDEMLLACTEPILSTSLYGRLLAPGSAPSTKQSETLTASRLDLRKGARKRGLTPQSITLSLRVLCSTFASANLPVVAFRGASEAQFYAASRAPPPTCGSSCLFVSIAFPTHPCCPSTSTAAREPHSYPSGPVVTLPDLSLYTVTSG